MDMNLDVIQAMLRGVSAACLLLLFIRSVYQYRALAAGLWFAVLCLGLMAYVLLPLLFELVWLRYPAVVLAMLVPPVFWLFCDALFNEQKHRLRFPIAAGLAVTLFVLVSLGSFLIFQHDSSSFARSLLFITSYALRLGFLALAIFVLIRSWSDDLVASRRSLRTLLLIITAGYILVVLVVELTLGNRAAPPVLETVHSGSMAAVLLIVAVWFLIANPASLFATSTSPKDASEAAAPSRGLSHNEQAWLEQLDQFMNKNHGYRRHDLSIGLLAAELKIPEHLLRRLINQHLGFRNFRQYLNEFRLQEAAARLNDPAQANLPILTIALDTGFGSITPFNRAFREVYGLTPSEYRRKDA
jgi:AraC-like DNA-binding protein